MTPPETDSDFHTQRTSSDLRPVLTSVAAALASLAFFKPWAVIWADLGSPGSFELTGAYMARATGGPVPWLYITPASMILILGASFVRLLGNKQRVLVSSSLLQLALAVPAVIWPANPIGHILHNLGVKQSTGVTAMSLRYWWWIYCVSLAAIAISGIIDLVIVFRNPGRFRRGCSTI